MSLLLYAATTNPGKLAEFAARAAAEGINVLPLPGLKDLPEPVEDAVTFAGNAALKAVAYSQMRPGMLVLCDDSGIALDALGGEPGVRSARYADDADFEPGAGSKDERNNRLLLHRMQHHTDRSARFLCALAVARDGQVVLTAEAEACGELLNAPRGSNGFGYDPLFYLPEPGRTMAELAPAEKWAVSHRGKAFRNLLQQMRGRDL
jgi:XTP/dITP diphosphohydrolase